LMMLKPRNFNRYINLKIAYNTPDLLN